MSTDLSRLYHEHIKFSRHPPPSMPNVIRKHREKYASYYNRESKKPPMPKVIREYRKSVKNYEDHMALECKRLGYVKLRKGLTPKTRKSINRKTINRKASPRPKTRKIDSLPKSNYHYREVHLNDD